MNYLEEINFYFPIHSQTSDEDKVFLLKTSRLIKERAGSYSYLEIGSFFGGTLVPFLMDNACVDVLSVDEREKHILDERGVRLNYTGVTSGSMIDKISGHGISTTKLRVHDGSIDTVADNGAKYDLIFIDGEHTDAACFKDFIWSISKLKENGIVLFHDSSFIFKAITMATEFLKAQKIKHSFWKVGQSDMAGLFIGNYADEPFEEIFGYLQDWGFFCRFSEDNLIKNLFWNRLSLTYNVEIKEHPTFKTY